MGIKYPDIKIQLTGEDGNAFAILGAVKKGLKRGGVSDEEQKEFMDEATAGDYNHLLVTAMQWVDVE